MLTPGFQLPAKYVIHAAGPVYDQKNVTESHRLLKSAYTESLALAWKNDCESIAFPLISSGIYGYPKKEALRVAASPQICPDFLKADKPSDRLDDLVDNLDEPISTTILRLIDAKGMTDTEVYKRANIDRRLFLKIRSGKGYFPGKRDAEQTEHAHICAG